LKEKIVFLDSFHSKAGVGTRQNYHYYNIRYFMWMLCIAAIDLWYHSFVQAEVPELPTGSWGTQKKTASFSEMDRVPFYNNAIQS
jgi:hypothetical protein